MRRYNEGGPKDIVLEDHSWDELDLEVKREEPEELFVAVEDDIVVDVEVKVEIEFQGHRVVATEEEGIKIPEIVVPEEFKQVMSALHLVVDSAVKVEAQFFPYQRGLKLLGEDFMWRFKGMRIEEIEVPPEGAKTTTMELVNDIVASVEAVREKIDGMEAASFAFRCGDVWRTILWDDEIIQQFEGRWVAQYEKKDGRYYVLSGLAVPEIDAVEHPWRSLVDFPYEGVKEGVVLLLKGEEFKLVKSPTYTVRVKAGLVNDDSLRVSPLIRDGCYDVDLSGKMVRKRLDKVRPDGEIQRRAIIRSPKYEDVVALLRKVQGREVRGFPRIKRKLINKIYKQARLQLDGKEFEVVKNDSSGKYHRYVVFRDCTTNHNKRLMRKIFFKNEYYGIWY